MIKTTITNEKLGLQAIIFRRFRRQGTPKPWRLWRKKWGKMYDEQEGWITAAFEGFYATEDTAILAGRKYVSGRLTYEVTK